METKTIAEAVETKAKKTSKKDISKMDFKKISDLSETRIRVRLTFINDVLGMSPGNDSIYRDYIASKIPEEDRAEISVDDELEAIASIDDELAKKMMVFPKSDFELSDGTVLEDHPLVWDYQIKGYFKDNCKAMKSVKGSISENITTYKKVIDKLIHVVPRKIPFLGIGPDDIDVCERSLRASGPQGERIAISISESVKAGCSIEFEVVVMDPMYANAVREWLEVGFYTGFMGWRNSGMGRFFWEELDADGNVIYTNEVKK